MKHFFLCLLAIPFLSPTLFSQNDDLQHFMDQHKGDKGFTYAFLSKDLLEVATHSDIKNEDWKGIHNMVKNIGSLRILAGDSIQNGLPLYREVRDLIPTQEVDELLTVRDGKENIRIWAKSAASTVTDLILLVGAPDHFVLVCFAGNLELENLSELAQLFNAGKASQLAQTVDAIALDFDISPNPNNGTFNLSYSNEQDPPTQLSVMDQNGRTVSTVRLSPSENQQVTLPILNAGFFWVQLSTQKGNIGVKQIQIVK